MSVFPTKILSAVCHISMGQAPKGDSYNAARRGYPLIAGAGDFGEQTPAPKKYTDAPTKLSRPGDIILCIRATIGDRNWSDKEYCLGRGVAGLRAKDADLSQSYLGHWLDHVGPALRTRGRGATFLQVSKSDIASLQIPLPPLTEQKRIARILDAADALRAKRREALGQLVPVREYPIWTDVGSSGSWSARTEPVTDRESVADSLEMTTPETLLVVGVTQYVGSIGR